jgi:hypothetical protein
MTESWQFLCGTTDDPADARVVGLGRPCDRDRSATAWIANSVQL